MTRAEFEVEYSADRGYMVVELRERGMVSGPCNCGAARCPGWQAIRLSLEHAIAIGGIAGSCVKRFGETGKTP